MMIHNLLAATELYASLIIAYGLAIVFFVLTIKGMVKAIKEKNVLDILTGVFWIPFLLFFIFSITYGGSAFNEAATDYELYQVGHYYLASHGSYTEVPYEIYSLMRVMEIVGITTFFVAIAIKSIEYCFKNKKQKDKRVNNF